MNLDLPLQYRFVPALLSKPRPSLLIVLHGRGDSPEGFAWLPSALGFDTLSYLFLQAPDPYYTGYSWYDLPPDQGPGIVRSRKLLGDTLNQLWTLGFSPQNSMLLGFSQGCLLTLEFGARYEKPLAGYIGISGYCYDEIQLAAESLPENRTAPWLITHGTNDDVLPIDRTRAQIRRLIEAGFKIDYREYDKNHTIDERDEFPAIRQFILQSLGTEA